MSNPLAALSQAEANLIAAVNATAAALEAIAVDPLAEAMARLREAAEGAKQRLQAARNSLVDIVADVLGEMNDFTQAVLPPVVVLPEPLPEPAGVNHPAPEAVPEVRAEFTAAPVHSAEPAPEPVQPSLGAVSPGWIDPTEMRQEEPRTATGPTIKPSSNGKHPPRKPPRKPVNRMSART